MKNAIVLGTFDGLHEGHRAVISKASDFYSIAVTFLKPPKSYFCDSAQLLILPEDRFKRMKKLGIDEIKAFDFAQVRHMTPQEFLDDLVAEYNPARIVCGFNYRFGKDAAGDTKFLEEFCNQRGIEFICVPPIQNGDTVISSTQIRNLIKNGNMLEAATQIYGGFKFNAIVNHGDARGRTLGFPTANQEYPKDLVTLKFGVYLSRVTVDGKSYKAITNVGVRPTYRIDVVGCETFIKDFDGDIYGKQMETELIKFVRSEQKFGSAQELKTAVLNDIKLLD